MSEELRDIITAIDKFESDLGFAAPEVIPDHIERLRGRVRGIFEEARNAGSEPAKVIVVVEQRGEHVSERRYRGVVPGNGDYGQLQLATDDGEAAIYQPQAWLSWREDGHEAPDATARALGIAKRALERIAATEGSVVDPAALWQIAQEAVEGIFAETEL